MNRDKIRRNQTKAKLGMDSSTANYKLLRKILYNFVLKIDKICYRCGKYMNKNNISIDHKKHWRQSNDPKKSFFNLKNISFSHLSCNTGHTSLRKYDDWLTGDRKTRYPGKIKADKNRKYNSAKRRLQYLRTGK